MDGMIKSSSNKTIKHIKSLQLKKFRDKFDEFVIEGEKLLKEAINYNASVSMVLLSRSFEERSGNDELKALIYERNIPLYYAEDSIIKELSETDTPQGVIAVVKKLDFDQEKVIEKDELSIVLLHEVRDPGNTGVIIRTADACGLDAVFLSKGTVDLYNGKTIRATMGSLFHIPVLQNLNTKETILMLKGRKVVTIGADPHSGINCMDLPYAKKTAILIGNESQGIVSEIQELLDISVKIPMPGKAESLNAGIAASILMYELYVRKKYYV